MSEFVAEGRTRLRKRGGRRHDISPEQIETSLATLNVTRNVVSVSQAAGFSTNWAYRWRKFDGASATAG